MNANAYYSQKISDSERDAFEQALTIYYTGKRRIVDAFAQVERGLIDRYYRRKKTFPDEMAEIDRKARAAALHQRDGQLIHLEAALFELSYHIQLDAAEALLEALPRLASIAKGEPQVVEFTDENGERQTKTIFVYPRDMIQAVRVLQRIARDGVMPQSFTPRLSAAHKEPVTRPFDPLELLLPVPANFSTLTAMGPESTQITAAVNSDGDIIDADSDLQASSAAEEIRSFCVLLRPCSPVLLLVADVRLSRIPAPRQLKRGPPAKRSARLSVCNRSIQRLLVTCARFCDVGCHCRQSSTSHLGLPGEG